MSLSDYRSEFPVTETLVYLNHAGVAPTSVRVRDAVTHWLDRHITRGILDEDGWEETAELCRTRFAKLIGASPLVDHNTVSGNDYGLTASNSTPFIVGNRFESNIYNGMMLSNLFRLTMVGAEE